MEILGVGIWELVLIFLIALIVLGPQDMVKAGRTLGRFVRRLLLSQEWQTFQQAQRDMRDLPTRLMREAGLDDQEIAALQRARQKMGATGLTEDMRRWRDDLVPDLPTRDDITGVAAPDLSAAPIESPPADYQNPDDAEEPPGVTP